MTERADRLHVIGMVVRNQQRLHRTERYAVVLTVFLQCPEPYSDVYDECVCRGRQIVAITTAAATKRYKFQHPLLIFVQRYE